jgi:hypothetical protein
MDEFLLKLTLSMAVFLFILVITGFIIYNRLKLVQVIDNIHKKSSTIFCFFKKILFYRKYKQLNKIKKDIDNIVLKIQQIKKNILILSEHISLLDEISDEDILRIQNNILDHFILYYNKYCSVYLRMNFMKNLEILKITNTKCLNVNNFVNEINNNIKGIKESVTTFPETAKINFNIIEATMININRKIKKITRELIIKETVGIIKNNSPIYDKENIIKLINYDYKYETIDELIKLNDEYAKFLGEMKINRDYSAASINM